MSGILNKLKDFVGLGEPPQYYDHEYDDEEVGVDSDYPEPYQEAPQNNVEEERSRRRSLKHLVSVSETGEVITKDNVIDMPVSPNRTSEVMVMEPRSFEEMPQAIQALKEQKTLVLNLTMMEPEQAQRAVDFVAGGTYAMDGHQERIGESIFLFTPKSVKVSSQDATLHDVPQVYPRGQRVNSPAPSWSGEARVAQ